MALTVKNFDVAGLADRMSRFAQEIRLSQSAGTAEYNEHDRNRVESYLQAMEKYMDVITDPDQTHPLDLPKAHPSMYPIQDFLTEDEINGIENQSVRDIVRRFKAGWVEVTQSQSKDRGSGLQVQDKDRMVALIASTRKVLAFAETTVDLPEGVGDTDDSPPVMVAKK